MARLEKLVFVGLNSYVVALDRDSGEIVWSNDDHGTSLISILT